MNATTQIADNFSSADDDSKGAIVTRVCNRVKALGFDVDGVYTDGWARSSHPDFLSCRSWDVDVIPHGAVEAVGSVIILERILRKDPNGDRSMVIGYSNEAVKRALKG